MTEALQVAPVSPPGRIATVLNDEKLLRTFEVDLTRSQLVATDTDFTRGAGRPIRLPAKDLLLICTTRYPILTEVWGISSRTAWERQSVVGAAAVVEA